MPVMPQKLAGWRIEPPVSVPVDAGRSRRGDRGGRAARRAARHARLVPRVAGDLEGRVLGARAHRELVAVELAERDRAGRGQPRDDGGIERAPVSGQHARAGRGVVVARDEDVLVRDRYADERAVVARGTTSVGALRLLDRAVGIERERGAESIVEAREAIQLMLRELDARDLARRERAAERRDAELVRLAGHSTTRGTR